MSEKLIAVTTQIGKQKAFLADQESIKIKITHIAVGDGAYVPNENQTSLKNELDRIPILSSKIDTENYLINFGAIIDNDKSYWVNEIGFYLDDGTLFAVWSHPTIRLGEKTQINKFLFGYSLQLVDVGLDRIEVVDAGIDLTLNYSKEFLTMGLSITRLGAVVVKLNSEVKSAIEQCDEVTKLAISKMQTVQNNTLIEMSEVLDELGQTKKEFETEAEEIRETQDGLLGIDVSNAKAIAYLGKKLIGNVGNMSDQEIRQKFIELSKSDADFAKEIKEQIKKLLSPIVSNSLGIARIGKIILNNKE